MTWAFAFGRRGVSLWLGRAGCAAVFLLGAASACSAGSAAAPPGQSGGDQSVAGDQGAGTGGTSGSGAGGASGAGATAGAAGGSSGSGPVTLTITQPGNCGVFTMALGQSELQVDPSHGARITSLKASGGQILADQTVTGDAIDWGSTFWPSPQKWPWPPTTSIPAVDSNAYTCGAADAASFTLQGGATTSTNANVPTISVTKKFSADLVKEALIIDYTMTNTGTAAVMVAPWEFSRVPAGALAFYGSASAPSTKSGTFALPTTVTMNGVTWYQHDPSKQYKLFADGAGGWLAAVVGGSVFVKQFPDVPAAAQPTTEAEIEVYSAAKYMEVEAQGPYASLAAGASVTWTVRWYARPLPAGATAAVGDANLLAFVQSLVQ